MVDQEDFRLDYNPAEDTGPVLDRKVRSNSRKSELAEFSSKARRDYVTGFRRRKLERQQRGKAEKDAKLRRERAALKKERNKAIYGDLAALQKQWDEEAAQTAQQQQQDWQATSHTASKSELTYGAGANATSVTIEPFDMHHSDTDSIVSSYVAPTLTAKAKRAGLDGGRSAAIARASAHHHSGERKAGTMKERKRQASLLKQANASAATQNAMKPQPVAEDGDDQDERSQPDFEAAERPSWWKKPRSVGCCNDSTSNVLLSIPILYACCISCCRSELRIGPLARKNAKNGLQVEQNLGKPTKASQIQRHAKERERKLV